MIFLFKTFVSLKLKVFLGTSFSLWGTYIAVETFNQQLILALIAAFPPTAAVIVTCVVLMKGQQKMAVAMDGKLSELISAEKGKSAGEAVAKERLEERERKSEDAVVTTAAATAAAVAAAAVAPGSSAENPVHTNITNTPDDPANVNQVKPKDKL